MFYFFSVLVTRRIIIKLNLSQYSKLDQLLLTNPMAIKMLLMNKVHNVLTLKSPEDQNQI